ncbi:uncharacterized protein H6S33_010888 [Morchella sextelata]|uniref:uncharacterized protein n=1 Tax=Morchella sextelata TaxID=1174677 RepID=UPI001D055EE2|nr:uncharacterized protein H6S33_010888 [Morchella sextelata]KAH0611623.1 hypothetical protein H6S33_010888 [Morchella sextelata]
MSYSAAAIRRSHTYVSLGQDYLRAQVGHRFRMARHISAMVELLQGTGDCPQSLLDLLKNEKRRVIVGYREVRAGVRRIGDAMAMWGPEEEDYEEEEEEESVPEDGSRGPGSVFSQALGWWTIDFLYSDSDTE